MFRIQDLDMGYVFIRKYEYMSFSGWLLDLLRLCGGRFEIVVFWPEYRSTFTILQAPVLSGNSKIDKTKILMTDGSLMKVESIAECSLWSILQDVWPALRDNQSRKPILAFFFSDRLRQVLLNQFSKMVDPGINYDGGAVMH